MGKAVIIGSSSGVGRALCRRLASAGWSLVIVSRDQRDVDRTAADLRLRFGVRCEGFTADIAEANFDVERLLSRCSEDGVEVDALLVPAGCTHPDDEGPNPDVIDALTATNFVGPGKLAAAFGQRMRERGRGQIVLFSSIAAVAPRSKNPAYSAAKAALETYARGLRHALSRHGVEVSVLALGYVDTPQSFGMRLLFPVSAPETVADHVLGLLEGTGNPGGRRYFPRYWSMVTTGLRALPWSLYRQLQF